MPGGGGGGARHDAKHLRPRLRRRENVSRGGRAAQSRQECRGEESASPSCSRQFRRDANIQFLAGLADAGLNDLKGAQDHYEKAVKYDRKLVAAHQQLALTYAKLGDRAKAEAALAKLKKLNDDCRGTCEQAQQLKDAVAAVEAALAGTPAASLETAPSLLFASAGAGDQAYLEAVGLINERRYEDAIASACSARATASARIPTSSPISASPTASCSRFEVAEDYYRQALAAAPNHKGATEYYGELMVERGDIAGARKMLARLESLCTFGCAEADELRNGSHGKSPPPRPDRQRPAACAADRPPPCRSSEARWLAARRLSRTCCCASRGECVAWPASPPLNDSAAIGRAAFRAPLAARRPGGARRPQLRQLPPQRPRTIPISISPAFREHPGTADVTASLMSSHRGDGKFNPKQIPDLADPAQNKVSRDSRRDDLRKFIRGLIVEEFDGPEPPPAVLQGLIDLCSVHGPGRLPGAARSQITLGGALADVERSASVLPRSRPSRGDGATARVLLGAARSTLGRIDERFSVPGLDQRARDSEVRRRRTRSAAASSSTRANARSGAGGRRAGRRARRALAAAESRSLYSAVVLRKRLASRG